jgi:hypothetical protein
MNAAAMACRLLRFITRKMTVFVELTFSGRLLHVNGVFCHDGMLVPTLMASHDGPSDEPHP